ncbi:F-box protein family-like [Rhynchospora pubera]|uniref:F-box protein family-like n=1 Tax=Rhynchospora pubera TaxID=906938 RepID=A0AAV8FH56_9POAL|nr:F-box protein family-like [Rhynchospora pubera]
MPRPKSIFPCGFGEQPWLIQTPGSEKETQTFINPLKGSVEERTIPEMDGQLCLSRFEEWLFLVDDLSDDCFLLNIYSLEKIRLPPIEEPFATLGLRILTSAPTSPDCAVIFLGREENFLLFCQPCKCKTRWTKLPVEFNVVGASRMLSYNRKLYILLDDIEIIDLASLSTNFVETASMDKPEFCSFGIGFVEHMVESCGDIFFVRTLFPSLPKASSIVDFEIYQLDFANQNSWMRVEGIGDSTFFLDRHGGQSFCSHDSQFDQNCIYHALTCYDGERIYKICLDDQTISFNLLPANAVQDECSFYWILPVIPPIQKHAHLTSSETIIGREVCQKGCYLEKQHKNREVPISIAMPLAELPIDIMQKISEQLPLKDAGRLRTVCKPWAKQLPNPMKEEGVWLMYCPKICGACQMYNPCKGKQFTLNMNKHSSFDVPMRLLFSKDGWVLALKGSNFLYFLNPFTKDFRHLPRLEDDYSYKGIAFSCAPKNSLNCMVFAVSGPPRGDFMRIITWRYGKKKWFEMQFENEIPFHVANNNPVFFHGEFYCLSRRGNLGVFNPKNNTWRVLDQPPPIYSDAAPDIGTEYCYLMECKGQLISVFQPINMDNVCVFKLNRSMTAWTLLEDIGDLTLFLDYRTSIARTLPCKSYNNKLYLPRLPDETNKATFFYCMKSRMHNPDIKSFRVPYNCVWLEPQLQ